MYFRGSESRHVKGPLDDLLKKLEKGTHRKATAVLDAWNESVDSKTKIHSRPVSLKNGILVVVVENSSLLYKLTLEKNKILEVFNEKYRGRKKPKDIRFRIGSLDF